MSSQPTFTAANVNAKLEQKVARLFANAKFREEFDAWLDQTVDVLPFIMECNTPGLVDLFEKYEIPHRVIDAWFGGNKAGMQYFTKFFSDRNVRLVVLSDVDRWRLMEQSASAEGTSKGKGNLAEFLAFLTMLKTRANADSDSDDAGDANVE